MTMEKSNNGKGPGRELQVFVQGEGLGQIRLVKADAGSTIGELVADLAERFGGDFAAAAGSGGLAVTLENDDRELPASSTLEQAGVTDRKRVHVHRCRKVRVSVNFNGATATDDFPPANTVGKVKKWADKKFEIDEADATEHALQLCGTADRPDEDAHVGTLTNGTACSICFDLVPKRRVEGAGR
jgi:hypothetical protein